MRNRSRVGAFACIVAMASAPMSCRDFSSSSRTNGGSSSVRDEAGAANGGGGASGGTATAAGEAGAAPAGAGVLEADAGGAAGDRAGGGTGDGGNGMTTLGPRGFGGDGEAGKGGEGGGSPLAPSAFPQLVLWLEASVDTVSRDAEERVLTWTDRTQNRNDAVKRTPFQAPTFVEAAVNGHAALRFASVLASGNVQDPSALLVPDSQSIRFGVGDFAYLLVMRWSNDPKPDQPRYSGTGVILGKQTLTNGFPGILLMANYPAIFADALSATRFSVQLKIGGAFGVSFHDGLNDSVFRVYTLRRTAAGVGFHINGADEGGTALAADFDLSAPGEPLIIGGNRGQPLRGDIAEIIGLKGTTSDADMARLVEHLMQKYQLE